MIDQVEADITEEVPDLRIADVHLHEVGTGGHVGQASGRQVVDDPDFVTGREVRFGHVARDESGAAGYQDFSIGHAEMLVKSGGQKCSESPPAKPTGTLEEVSRRGEKRPRRLHQFIARDSRTTTP